MNLKTGWQAVEWVPTFSGAKPTFSKIYETERECRLRHPSTMAEIREVIIEESGNEQKTHTFSPPKQWTSEEIEAGYKGIRWVTKDGVYGRPTPHDIRTFLGYTCDDTENEAAEELSFRGGDV